MFPRSIVFVLVILLAGLASGKEHYSQPGPAHLDAKGQKWVEKTLRDLSLEEKIGQLFVIWARAQFLNANSAEYRQLTESIQHYGIGGFALSVPVEGPFLLKSEPYEAALLLNRLQRQSKLPLLVAADFETGLASRLNGTTTFPNAMAFGAAGKTNYAEAFGSITAQEARAIGVHWNFFPDADVNSNPANPIINIRSFGEDSAQVGELVTAYIRGARLGGMMTTAKHFPGHGDTATDSHLGVAQVSGDMARLESVELPPFRKAIQAGVDAVMVAHVTVPALEPEPDRVAVTSPAIVTKLLKQQLGFKGIVVSDALDMAAVTHLYAGNIGREAVDAIKAGNDVLLIPPDLAAAYHAMLDAVRSGEISRERLDQSVRKILEAKAALNLQHARLVDVNALEQLVGKPESVAAAQAISDDAITLVRNNGKVLPLNAARTAKSALPYQAAVPIQNRVVVVVFPDDVRMESGRVLERQIRARVPDARVLYADPNSAAAMAGDILKAVEEAQTVVAAVYVVPAPGVATQRSSVNLRDATGTLLQQMLDRAAQKTVVVAVGNPYLARDFPTIENYLCTFSTASVSELSAVKALFGEIAIRGHLPVSIPNYAQRGDGIELPTHAAE
jgi:beta-N-acetylhexosaminidase